ncbi:MAG TPA: hypothetical protein VF789_21165 [Thermoanaerobaculia bacterium]
MASPKSAPERPLPSRRLFGLNLASDFPFSHHLAEGDGEPDLTFTLTPRPLLSGPWRNTAPVYVSPYRMPDGESVFHLYRIDGYEILNFPGTADFFLQEDRIACHVLEPDLVELRLLGPVLSYCLERRGLPTLHASAVAVDGRAVAFLSRQGGGKTGLAAALMRAGRPLLTDDVLPVEDRQGTFFARPGYPQMRMWPDEAAWFLDRWEELPLVHPQVTKRRISVGPGGFGEFLDASLPLAGLYIPERRPDGPVEIVDVPPRDALIELVRYSFSPHLVEAAGLQPFRFDLFARLVQKVPVRRLRYPAGFERLAEVAEVVAGRE